VGMMKPPGHEVLAQRLVEAALLRHGAKSPEPNIGLIVDGGIVGAGVLETVGMRDHRLFDPARLEFEIVSPRPPSRVIQGVEPAEPEVLPWKGEVSRPTEERLHAARLDVAGESFVETRLCRCVSSDHTIE